jgi:hypothetical protein
MMDMADGKALNLSVLANQASGEEAAWLFLEASAVPEGPVCSHCGTVNYA